MRLVSLRRLWPLLFLWISFPATAHEIRPAVVTVTFEQDRYRVEISTNLEAVLAGYVSSAFREPLVLAVVIVLLMIRPSGLLGGRMVRLT